MMQLSELTISLTDILVGQYHWPVLAYHSYIGLGLRVIKIGQYQKKIGLRTHSAETNGGMYITFPGLGLAVILCNILSLRNIFVTNT